MSKIETFLYAQTPETDPQTEFRYRPEMCAAREVFVRQTVSELAYGSHDSRDYNKNRDCYFDTTTGLTLSAIEPLLQEMASDSGFLHLNGYSTPRLRVIDPDARIMLVDHIGCQVADALCKEARQRSEAYKTLWPGTPMGSNAQTKLAADLNQLFEQKDGKPSHDRAKLKASTHRSLVGFHDIEVPVGQFREDLKTWIKQLILLQDYTEAQVLLGFKTSLRESPVKSKSRLGRWAMEIRHKKS